MRKMQEREACFSAAESEETSAVYFCFGWVQGFYKIW